jgi:signal transduction histidine kinase
MKKTKRQTAGRKKSLGANHDTLNNLKDYIDIMEHVRGLIHSTLDFDELMQRLIVVASETLACQTSAIALREPGQWQIRYTYGFPEEIKGLILSDNEALTASTAETTLKPVVILDAYNDIRANKAQMEAWKTRSLIAVPLRTRESVIGVIYFNFEQQVDAFSPLTLEFVHSLSTSISMALQNIRLYELARAEANEQKMLEKYRTLFTLIDEGFGINELIYDSEGHAVDWIFIEVNPAFEKHTGLKDVQGKRALEVNPESENHWLEIYGRVAATGEPIRFIREVCGLNRWLEVYAFRPDHSKSNQIATLLKDVTAEIRAKDAMEQTIRIQDEIFTNVAHELKTPLNMIFSGVQAVEYSIRKDQVLVQKDKNLRILQMVKQNCYRFTKLINNIIDESKMDSGFMTLELENENIVELIASVVQSVSEYIREKGLKIDFYSDLDEVLIACDREKVERIILNLISNAIKFSHPQTTINVSVNAKEDYVEIQVKDAGIGIGEDELHKIFKRFHKVDQSMSRNTEGTGIGLSLVKSFVELHGGSIQVESEPNQGSTFSVKLPFILVDQEKKAVKLEMAGHKKEMIDIEFSDVFSPSL